MIYTVGGLGMLPQEDGSYIVNPNGATVENFSGPAHEFFRQVISRAPPANAPGAALDEYNRQFIAARDMAAQETMVIDAGEIEAQADARQLAHDRAERADEDL